MADRESYLSTTTTHPPQIVRAKHACVRACVSALRKCVRAGEVCQQSPYICLHPTTKLNRKLMWFRYVLAIWMCVDCPMCARLLRCWWRCTFYAMIGVPQVQQEMVEEIGADLFQPTQSVSLMLEPFGEAGHAFLNDPDLLIAASPIDYGRGISDSVDAASPGSTTDNNNNNIGEGTDDAAVARRGRGSSKVDEVGRMRQAKADAIRRIMARHTTNDDDGVNNEAGGGGGSGAAAPKLLPVSVAERCLHSIGDALSFISVSTASVEAMISLLLHFFDPHDDGGGVDNRSLRLRYGSGGELQKEQALSVVR